MNNSPSIDRSGMVPIDEISDEDAEETRLLKERAAEAQRFLLSFKWCRSIQRGFFAGGFSHIAVFYFEIDNTRPTGDHCFWIICGDLPPAYLVIDVIPDYKEALLVYVYEMRQWIAAVKNKQNTADCIPVNVAPTLDHALALESRLDFIENTYVPSLQ